MVGELGPFVEMLSEGRCDRLCGVGGFVARPRAVRGGRWLLTGRPEPTQYASVADIAVVATDEAVYAQILGEGKRPPHEPSMDRTRPLGWLALDSTPVWRIGGADAAARLLDRAATAAAAQLLGASERALEMSVEYAKVRRQFGHPIGSFQAVKHRLADALVDVEAMRSSAYYAAWCLATEEPGGVGRGLDGEGVVLGRFAAGDGLGDAGARWHRLHLGVRPPPLRQAGPARREQLRQRPVPS